MQSQLTTSLAEVEQGGSEKCTTLPSLISFDLEQQGESTEGEQRRRSKEFWFTAIFAVFFFLIGFIWSCMRAFGYLVDFLNTLVLRIIFYVILP